MFSARSNRTFSSDGTNKGMENSIMTLIRTFLAGAFLAVSLSTAAQEPVLDSAYEVALEDFRLPASTAGNVALRECDGCELVTIRVDLNTIYRLNGESVDLRDFRRTVLLARRGSVSKPVIVLRNLETNTVRSVSVNL